MDLPTFTARARALAAMLLPPLAAEEAPERLRIHAEARPHPQVPGERTYVEVDAPQGIDLFHGAFLEALAVEAGFDAQDLLERCLRHAALCLEEAPAEAADERLFGEHARFRRGLETPAGWYRGGEALAHGAWAVDLDLFVEVVLPVEAWGRLRGTTTALTILGEDFEIEIPREASFDEIWTLPECGVFEPLVGQEVEEEEEVPGRFGDLHIVPIAL